MWPMSPLPASVKPTVGKLPGGLERSCQVKAALEERARILARPMGVAEQMVGLPPCAVAEKVGDDQGELRRNAGPS
jgi:hypothetical protein